MTPEEIAVQQVKRDLYRACRSAQKGLDIVDRLRGVFVHDGLRRQFQTSRLANEAADEIERLQKELAAAKANTLTSMLAEANTRHIRSTSKKSRKDATG